MDDAALVGEARGAQHLDGEVDRADRVQRRLLDDELLERAALEVLHRDVRRAVPFAAVEDADDVGVLQAGRARGLAAEALDELVVLGEAPVQQLERDLAAELLVERAVHVGHPARPDAVLDRVAAVDDGAGADVPHTHRADHPREDEVFATSLRRSLWPLIAPTTLAKTKSSR